MHLLYCCILILRWQLLPAREAPLIVCLRGSLSRDPGHRKQAGLLCSCNLQSQALASSFGPWKLLSLWSFPILTLALFHLADGKSGHSGAPRT